VLQFGQEVYGRHLDAILGQTQEEEVAKHIAEYVLKGRRDVVLASCYAGT
jgi:hypothetical protein